MPVWMLWIDRIVPLRYLIWTLSGIACIFCVWNWAATGTGALWALITVVLVVTGIRDCLQTRRAVLRNYPLIGHLRFLLEFVRPEIRQYFIESDNEALPFSRTQRSLVYQRAKGDPDQRPFGTQFDVQAAGYEWINHSLRRWLHTISVLP
jgi:glutamate synthase domain-containing protein 2